jgi:hypothetical protein
MQAPWRLGRAVAALPPAVTALALALAACSGAPSSHTATSSAQLPLTGGTATAAAASSPSPRAAAAAHTTVILFLTAPAHPGRQARLTVSTAPRARCKATVDYPGTSLRPTALGTRQADASGSVSWTWTLGARIPTGDWPLTVSCTPGGQAATVLTVR